MTADIELLPSSVMAFSEAMQGRTGALDAWLECNNEAEVRAHVEAYARANVARAVAAKDAEIAALRAERDRAEADTRRLAASGQGVEGWKLVPANATNNMQIAGLAALDESDATPDSIGHLIGYKAIREAYAAMVAAAPTQEKGNG